MALPAPRHAATATELVRARTGIDVREVDPIQLAGILLAGLLIAGMVLATISILQFATLVALPPAPAPPSPGTNENTALYKQLVDVYKTQNDIQLGRFTQVFQPVIVSVMLPVLTAVIGYTLGSKKAG